MNPGKTTFIIAEAGVNHNGSLEIAERLVDTAKSCGADAVKFQTFKAEKLVTRHAEKADYQKRATSGGDSQFEMLQRLELGDAEFGKLVDHCRHRGIEFLSSPFDEDSADLLDSLGVTTFKIPSGEITNHPLLKHIARKRKPVILSTGMCTLGEVEEAVEIFRSAGTPRLILLHCVTEYPAPYRDINLSAMTTLRAAFGFDVGYSDHTLGIEIPVAAVALGAAVIEKHFTLDTAMEGPDHGASLNPADFQLMVQAIRNVEQSLGDGIKRPAPCELKNMEIARKSIVAAAQIAKGEVITREKLAIKRPGNGIQPKELDRLVGLRASRAIGKDEVLTWKDLA
jgi:N-acetylneuraminate synthase/N,N'-diacetyllegionaminate synthase